MRKQTTSWWQNKQWKLLYALILVTGIQAVFCKLYAQVNDSLKTPVIRVDCVMVQKLEALGREEAVKSVALFKADQISLQQELVLNQLRTTTQTAISRLKAGIDTLDIKNNLKDIKAWISIAGEGVFDKKNTGQTSRNLTTTSKLLLELKSRTEVQVKLVERYLKDLHQYKFDIDSLYTDSVLYIFPKEEVAIKQYLEKIWLLAQEIKPADSALQKAITQMESLVTEVRLLNAKLKVHLEELVLYQEHLSSRAFNKDLPELSAQHSYKNEFKQIVHFSWAKAILILRFYAINHIGKIVGLFLLMGISTIFLRSLKKLLKEKQQLRDDFSHQLVLRYPFLSALVLAICIFQFLFPAPPFIFNLVLWSAAALALTFIFRNYINKFWMYVWLGFLSLFLLTGANNLLLQASLVERWYMIVLSVLGILLAVFALRNRMKQELKEKPILYFIALVIILELAAILFNVSGHYNISKTFLTIGYLNVVIGILFLWTIRLIDEGLFLASKTYTQQSSKLFYINFDIVGSRVPRIFYWLLTLGWLILIGRNFYTFHFLTDPIREFFQTERIIGDYALTINSVLLFFVIMGISVMISKIISFFATDKNAFHSQGGSGHHSALGSWVLLIRITVISIGLFLAVAATGVPLDRITLILGAIGVGLGLGLQALVNNLVSGLILAFERPVNVGDLVEIHGQVGTMKSIGFRSSVIAKGDGADVIMPNGDLLSAQLVNRSLSGHKRMIELLIPVAYGTALESLYTVILELLTANEKVLDYPQPAIFINNLNKFGIEVKIQFWIAHFSQLPYVKSEILLKMYETFKEKGIELSINPKDIAAYGQDYVTPKEETGKETKHEN
jgi:potassium efflux system protein